MDTDPNTLSLTLHGCNEETLSQGTALISQLVDNFINSYRPCINTYIKAQHKRSMEIINLCKDPQNRVPIQQPRTSPPTHTQSIKYFIYKNYTAQTRFGQSPTPEQTKKEHPSLPPSLAPTRPPPLMPDLPRQDNYSPIPANKIKTKAYSSQRHPTNLSPSTLTPTRPPPQLTVPPETSSYL